MHDKEKYGINKAENKVMFKKKKNFLLFAPSPYVILARRCI